MGIPNLCAIYVSMVLCGEITPKTHVIIKIVLAIIFALSVVGKLTGKTKSTFENAGYSPIIMYATAITENNIYRWTVYLTK